MAGAPKHLYEDQLTAVEAKYFFCGLILMSTPTWITERGKKQRKQISLQQKCEHFCSGSEKMRNACGLQGENKQQ